MNNEILFFVISHTYYVRSDISSTLTLTSKAISLDGVIRHEMNVLVSGITILSETRSKFFTWVPSH